MNSDQDRTVSYQGQQIMLVFSLLTLVLSLLFHPFGFLCAISVGVLGIWQIGDFIIFWLRNGLKKWYIWYIGLVLVAVLLTMLNVIFGMIYSLSLSYFYWNLWHK